MLFELVFVDGGGGVNMNWGCCFGVDSRSELDRAFDNADVVIIYIEYMMVLLNVGRCVIFNFF